MKANELMIGDFLRYKEDFPSAHLREKIVKVCGIRGRLDVRIVEDGKYHESEHPDWLEPIPLTTEILEKNGFQKKKISDYKSLFCVVSQNYNCLFLRWIGIPEFDVGNSFDEDDELQEFATIRYVHELQHALRLCGIDKEIEL